MYFSNWHDMIQMGHHGFYVWSSYSVALIILTWNIVSPLRSKRQWIRYIQEHQKSECPPIQRSAHTQHKHRPGASL